MLNCIIVVIPLVSAKVFIGHEIQLNTNRQSIRLAVHIFYLNISLDKITARERDNYHFSSSLCQPLRGLTTRLYLSGPLHWH
jgi:hypothetical protein